MEVRNKSPCSSAVHHSVRRQTLLTRGLTESLRHDQFSVPRAAQIHAEASIQPRTIITPSHSFKSANAYTVSDRERSEITNNHTILASEVLSQYTRVTVDDKRHIITIAECCITRSAMKLLMFKARATDVMI